MVLIRGLGSGERLLEGLRVHRGRGRVHAVGHWLVGMVGLRVRVLRDELLLRAGLRGRGHKGLLRDRGVRSGMGLSVGHRL